MKTLDEHNGEIQAKIYCQKLKQNAAGVICGHNGCTWEMVYKSDDDMFKEERLVVCPTGHRQGLKLK